MSPSRSPMPEVPLRRRLFLLAAVAIVPLAAMAGLGLLAMVEQHREQTERAGLDVTRAPATAGDAGLRRSAAGPGKAAASPPPRRGRTRALQQRAPPRVARPPPLRTG